MYFGKRSLSTKVTKMVIQVSCFILLFICFAESASGSCLSYGHACWGGHGKRNDESILRKLPDESISKENWLLYRLLQNAPFRKFNKNEEVEKNRHRTAENPPGEMLDGSAQDDSAKFKNQLFSDEFYPSSDEKLIKLLVN